VSLTPLLLAIAALSTVRRVIVELFAMVLCASAALTFRGSADKLIRAVTTWHE